HLSPRTRRHLARARIQEQRARRARSPLLADAAGDDGAWLGQAHESDTTLLRDRSLLLAALRASRRGLAGPAGGKPRGRRIRRPLRYDREWHRYRRISSRVRATAIKASRGPTSRAAGRRRRRQAVGGKRL